MSTDDGALPSSTVIRVLRKGGVSVVAVEDGLHEIEREDVRETQDFPEIIRRRDVLRLAHKFDVESRYFWNEEEMPGEDCDPEKPFN